jgi:creatinine amidohydrolase
MSWVQVLEHLGGDRRLIVPIGACDQFGAHLPLGAATLVAERLSEDLSQEFGVLRAPVLGYGVNVPGERPYPGAGSLRAKTLHGLLNDLLDDWEAQGFDEFILLTAHRFDPHGEALASVNVRHARIRVVEPLALDLRTFLEGEDDGGHGGELLTSLLLHLAPECVHLEEAEDYPAPRTSRTAGLGGRGWKIPAESRGAVGHPRMATAEKGSCIYLHLLEKIRDRVFLTPAEPTS